MLFSSVTLPDSEDIQPPQLSTAKKEKLVQINISQIYGSDLFGTYHNTLSESATIQEEPFPLPPEAQTAEIPDLPGPQFLDPLDITLRGIFVMITDNAKNRAIILDNKTKKESSVKVGDTIADAQLIRIFSNKIILLRSNGQQEVLFLREQDAKLDEGYGMINDWSMVVKPISGHIFMVDPVGFVHAVQDLGQFIEMVHLITAYKNGISLGCRVGTITEKSIGTALGLQAGDIITSVEGIPARTLEERLQIFSTVISKHEGDSIHVNITRNKQELAFEYILKELYPESSHKETPEGQHRIQELEKNEKKKILEQKYQFAPTLEDIRKKERELMLEKGRAPQ